MSWAGLEQDRQGEEIEALWRMVDMHPEVVRFAMENARLTGTGGAHVRAAYTAVILTKMAVWTRWAILGRTGRAAERLGAATAVPSAVNGGHSAFVRRLEDQVVSLARKLQVATGGNGAVVAAEELDHLRTQLADAQAAAASDSRRVAALSTVRRRPVMGHGR